MHYYGTRLSENISRREPEGYLLCLNVPVARTGTQDYLPEELGLPPRTASGGNLVGGNLTRNKQAPQCGAAPIESAELSPGPPGLVSVLRPEAEVFSPETIASFEGMPVTNDHPPDGVDIENIRRLQRGHAHNIRRGSGAESDLLLADLIITDPCLIDAILGGKREISCGYTYELCEEDGRYIQRKIRGNHIAVVDAGRAGPRVSIRDEKSAGSSRVLHTTYPERRKNIMKKSLSKVLARMAKDGDIETVAEFIEEMIEPETEPVEAAAEAVAEAVAEAAEPEEKPAVENAETVIAIDEASLTDILSRLDQIIALLTPAAADDIPEEIAEAVEEALEASEAADPMAEEVSAAMEEILEPVASVILEEEGDGEEDPLPETLRTDDALRAALAAVRPVLVRMPKKARRKMAGDIAARLRRTRASGRGTTGTDAYAALASARRRTAPASADLGRRIMEKRNVNYKKN